MFTYGKMLFLTTPTVDILICTFDFDVSDNGITSDF